MRINLHDGRLGSGLSTFGLKNNLFWRHRLVTQGSSVSHRQRCRPIQSFLVKCWTFCNIRNIYDMEHPAQSCCSWSLIWAVSSKSLLASAPSMVKVSPLQIQASSKSLADGASNPLSLFQHFFWNLRRCPWILTLPRHRFPDLSHDRPSRAPSPQCQLCLRLGYWSLDLEDFYPFQSDGLSHVISWLIFWFSRTCAKIFRFFPSRLLNQLPFWCYVLTSIILASCRRSLLRFKLPW